MRQMLNLSSLECVNCSSAQTRLRMRTVFLHALCLFTCALSFYTSYAIGECPDETAHAHSLARAFAARTSIVLDTV